MIIYDQSIKDIRNDILKNLPGTHEEKTALFNRLQVQVLNSAHMTHVQYARFIKEDGTHTIHAESKTTLGYTIRGQGPLLYNIALRDLSEPILSHEIAHVLDMASHDITGTYISDLPEIITLYKISKQKNICIDLGCSHTNKREFFAQFATVWSTVFEEQAFNSSEFYHAIWEEYQDELNAAISAIAGQMQRMQACIAKHK